MLNCIWLALILSAVIIGGCGNRLPEVAAEGLNRATYAVMDIALPLIGIWTLWLGIMRLAERSGLVQSLARGLRPLLRLLFPEVPADHPAMGSMVMNIAANMLGLSNAATPLGLRAMKDLETLNPRPGTATNAMCTFLAINTSSVQLIPVTAVGVLVANHSQNPSAIIGTAFLATLCAATCAVVAVKVLARLPAFALPPVTATEKAGPGEAKDAGEPILKPVDLKPLAWWGVLVLTAYFAFFGWFFLRAAFPELLGRIAPAETAADGSLIRAVKALSLLAIPMLLSFVPLYAALSRIRRIHRRPRRCMRNLWKARRRAFR